MLQIKKLKNDAPDDEMRNPILFNWVPYPYLNAKGH